MFQLAVRNIVRPCARLDKLTVIRAIATSSDVKNSDVLNKGKSNGIELETSSTSSKFHQMKIKRANRVFSTLHHSVPAVHTNTTFASKEDSREFMSVFPDVVRDLTEYSKRFDDKYVAKWFAKSLQYNVPSGKKNRGLAAVLGFKSLAPASEITPENIRLSQILGWCVETVQSVFLLYDDIMDGSVTRRGEKCWYKLEDVGMTAINDVLMVENGLYYILKKHFGNKPYYVQLLELFHEMTFITTVGQFLDLNTSKMTIHDFSMDLYKKIVANKTAYYSFYLPVAAAMHMAGFTDPEQFRQAKTILLEMGQFYQIQDDFLDCFGDPEVTGKIGTDIQDNKCSWLAVMCMQRASPAQKKIMEECYGQDDPVKVQRIKDLYEELGLAHTFHLYEEESFNMIKTHIQQTSRGVPHGIFNKIMDKIYRRDA